MGVCESKHTDPEFQDETRGRNRSISKALRADAVKDTLVQKLLLLGIFNNKQQHATQRQQLARVAAAATTVVGVATPAAKYTHHSHTTCWKTNTNKRKTNAKQTQTGAGESGKSTIFKQLKIVHNKGFDAKERRYFAHIVHANILESMQVC